MRVSNVSYSSHYYSMQTQTPVTRLAGAPLLGSVLHFRNDRIGLQRRLASAGDLTRFRMGPFNVYMVSSAELAHQVLVEQSDSFIKSRGLSKFGRPLLGDGLLTSELEMHKRQRKLLSSSFTHKRIAGYAELMADRARVAHTRIGDGTTVDIAEEMMRLTLDIVGRALFDADLAGEARAIGDALTVAMDYMVGSVSRLINLPYAWPTPRNRRVHQAIARLDETVFRMIAERRREGVDKGDVLSTLLSARDEDDGTGMSDRQVRDESMTMLLAGHETTANALAWTFFLLTQHPDIYQRVEREVDSVLDGRAPTLPELMRMPYSLAVIKEAMRLYPPAYILGRQAHREVTIGGHSFPRGTIVMVNVFGMHHRADYFADPERFMPERFLGEAEKALPKGAYIPFGGGPRICIGNHFAMMEAHIILAAIAGNLHFDLARDPAVEPEPLVTLRPMHGLPAKVRRRRPSLASAAA